MACCAPTIVPFANVSSSTVAYTIPLQQKYGSNPKVFVYYQDPETGEYYISPFFTRMAFVDGSIEIDHGGENTGLIVIR